MQEKPMLQCCDWPHTYRMFPHFTHSKAQQWSKMMQALHKVICCWNMRQRPLCLAGDMSLFVNKSGGVAHVPVDAERGAAAVRGGI